MVVNANGEMEGSIGRGIMENKFVEMAKEKLQAASLKLQEAAIRKQIHDKSSKKDQSGMICSGEQTILLYPVQQKDEKLIRQLISSLEQNRNGALTISPNGMGFDNIVPEKNFEFNLKTEEDWI